MNPRTRVEVVEGDIAAQAVDAIVNAANNELWMGAGVAGAIKTRGGAEIEREAMALGPIRVGEAVAAGLGLASIAFPALGTGVGGFPIDECARVMLEAVRAHAAGPTSLERVVFVLWGRPV